MPNWKDLLTEINAESNPGPIDKVRRKYLRRLSDYTKRNTILYYSGWLQRNQGVMQSQIFDGDINSFMTVVHKLDTTKGLDLILHTPGGVTSATQAIVSYLRKKFGNNIRAFVPQLAMSGGTMISCACKEIYMGKQSSIGPIDPQFGSMAAFAVLEEFSRAADEIKKDPTKVPLWHAIFSKVDPGFLTKCQKAVELSGKLVTDWLISGMFCNDADSKNKAERIVKALNNHTEMKAHDRHINAEEAEKLGLNVIMLEDDQKLQDLVLTVHHACMHTFNQVNNLQKIVENQNGIGVFLHS